MRVRSYFYQSLVLFLFIGCAGTPLKKQVSEEIMPVEESQPQPSSPVAQPKKNTDMKEQEPLIAEQPVIVEQPIRITGVPEIDIPSAKDSRTLSAGEIERAALKGFSGKTFPVMKNSHPMAIYHDFDDDGLTDILLVSVDRQGDADYEILSDFSRLFRETATTAFFADLFVQKSGEMVRVFSLPLGAHFVLDSLSFVPLRKKRGYPFAAVVSFQMKQGYERQWIVFAGKSQVSLYSMKETLSSYISVDDIDQDGIQDIVSYERVFEEGKGYETYAVWHRWNGKEYKTYKSTAIVRNLTRFLERATELMIAGRWEEFVRFGVDPHELEGRKEKETSFFRGRIFIPQEKGLAQEHVDWKIVNVVFPEILENPFKIRDKNGYSFLFPIRVLYEHGESLVFSVGVKLNKNPFAARQFSFILH